MLGIALKSVRGHLGRFVLTLCSVMLGTALIAGTFALTDSLDDTFQTIFKNGSKGVDVQVRGLEGTVSSTDRTLRTPLPLSLAESLRTVPGVARAVPDLQGSVILVKADGTALRNSGAPTLGFGYDSTDPTLTITGGRVPQSPGEVLVEDSTLKRSGLAVGSVTTAVIQGSPQPVTIVGSASFASALFGATVVILDPVTAHAAFAPEGMVDSFTVTAARGVSQAELLRRIQPVVPVGAEAVTGTQVLKESQGALKKALGFISNLLLAFALVSVLVGSFIIANTFSMLVARRTRELALLRAVGAGRGQVFGLILGEAALVGFLGGVAGLAAGLGLAQGLRALFTSFGMDLAALPLRPRTVVVTLAVGLVVTLLSALLPALRASSVPPMMALRQDQSVPARSLWRRGLAGAAVLGASIALSVWAVAGAHVHWVAFSIAAVCAILGLVVLAPVAARPVIRVLAAPVSSGVVGRLARENALRVPRRTATTASALMIGLALICGVSVVGQSMKSSISDLVSSRTKADFILNGGQSPIPTEVAGKVAAIKGVASVATLSMLSLKTGGTEITATVTDPTALAAAVDLVVPTGTLAALDRGQILVATTEADKRGWQVGDTITADVGTARGRTLTIGGTFEPTQLLIGSAIAPVSLYRAVTPLTQQADLFTYVNLRPGANAAAVRAEMAAIVKPYLVVSVQDSKEFVDSQSSQVDLMLNILSLILALSVLIAVLGIINTLAMSVLERTREIGLLRAIGLGRLQLAGMITLESVTTALFGALLGTTLGLGLGMALQHGMRSQGLDTLSIPWGTIAAVVAAAALAGVVAAVTPAGRAVRMDVLAAIADD